MTYKKTLNSIQYSLSREQFYRNLAKNFINNQLEQQANLSENQETSHAEKISQELIKSCHHTRKNKALLRELRDLGKTILKTDWAQLINQIAERYQPKDRMDRYRDIKVDDAKELAQLIHEVYSFVPIRYKLRHFDRLTQDTRSLISYIANYQLRVDHNNPTVLNYRRTLESIETPSILTVAACQVVGFFGKCRPCQQDESKEPLLPPSNTNGM